MDGAIVVAQGVLCVCLLVLMYFNARYTKRWEILSEECKVNLMKAEARFQAAADLNRKTKQMVDASNSRRF